MDGPPKSPLIGLEWDSDQLFDPITFERVIPPWLAPYHEAAKTINAIRSEGEDSDYGD